MMRHFKLWLEQYEKRKKEIVVELRGYRDKINSVRDELPDNLLQDLGKPVELQSPMSFIDGGEGLSELMGACMYFIRASGLVINPCRNREVFVRDLDLNIIDHDEKTKERVELLRERMEVEVAIRSIREHDAKYVFLDGSLYVKARQKVLRCAEYEPYRRRLVQLLELCRKEGVHLIGVSEDSKSKFMANYLSCKYDIELPSFVTDSSILRILSPGQAFRSIEFTPKSRFEADDRLTSKEVVSFKTIYLQPTIHSNPLRIDVPDWEESFDDIIDNILYLCEGSRHFGYPIPLYLAHMDARISAKQAQWSTNQLLHHVMKNDKELYHAILSKNRKNMRPDG